MIINKEIQLLVYQIESEKKITPYLKLLLNKLQENCKKHHLLERKKYIKLPILESPYPIKNGYAVAFDPLIDEEQILNYWYQYGFVVGKNVVSEKSCDDTVKTINNIMNVVGMSLNNEATWKKDSNGIPLLSRGFFELYHDDTLAQIRQNIRLYLYHVILWGNPFLWTSFDRLGLKLPAGEESKGLPLHVDQNPTIHADFTTIQGVLALVDCPEERGTFVAVPGSKKYFSQYQQFIKDGYKGEYILLPENSQLYEEISKRKQFIPLKKGHFVSWDSRTTHANSDNYSLSNRYVMYTAMGLSREHDAKLVKIRTETFKNGLGENFRDAYLHASKKPRFTNPELISSLRKKEQLTELGQCLYGLEKYENILNKEKYS